MVMELIKTVFQSWPLAIVIIVMLFQRDLKSMLQELSDLSIVVAGVNIYLSRKDMAITATYLLNAMKGTLKPNDKIYFGKILSERKTVSRITVFDVFQEKINRNMVKDPVLSTLRALRGFGLIRPKNDGEWGDNSEIVVTDFGHFVSENKELKKLLEP